MENEEEEPKGKGPMCDSCHMAIGRKYMEHNLNRVAKSHLMLCDWCLTKLNAVGFLQITDLTQLLADGRIIYRHGALTPGEGGYVGRPKKEQGRRIVRKHNG
jgi:hypothetical protein